MNGPRDLQAGAVNLEDNVALLDLPFGRAAGGDGVFMHALADDERAVGDGQAHFLAELFVYHDVAHAEEWPLDTSVFQDVFHVAVGGVDRNSETDALGA